MNRLSHDEADPLFKEEFDKVINKDLIPEADQLQHHEGTPEIYDGYINMEIGLPPGIEGELLHARVKRRVIDNNGQPVGVESLNPITDTCLYERSSLMDQ